MECHQGHQLLKYNLKYTPGGETTRPAAPAGRRESPGGLLDDGDLLLREAVKLVNQGVDLPIGRLNLPREEGLLVAGLSISKPLVQVEHPLDEGHNRRRVTETSIEGNYRINKIRSKIYSCGANPPARLLPSRGDISQMLPDHHPSRPALPPGAEAPGGADARERPEEGSSEAPAGAGAREGPTEEARGDAGRGAGDRRRGRRSRPPIWRARG